MYTVQFADREGEARLVHAFTASVYTKYGHIQDPKDLKEQPPHAIFVTRVGDGRIVGALGIYLGRDESVLPLDRFFSLPGNETVCRKIGEDQAYVIEASRFCVAEHGNGVVAALLLGGLYEFILRYSCHTILACVKPVLLQRIKDGYGLPVEKVNGCSIRADAIPSDYASYFLPNDPAETPVVMRIRMNRETRSVFKKFHALYRVNGASANTTNQTIAGVAK